MDIRDTIKRTRTFRQFRETKWQKPDGNHVFAKVQQFGDNEPKAGVTIGDMNEDEVLALADFLQEVAATMREMHKGE